MASIIQAVLVLFSFVGFGLGLKKRARRASVIPLPVRTVYEKRGTHFCMSQEEIQRRSRATIAERRTEPKNHAAARPGGKSRTHSEELSTREKFLIWKENAEKINEMYLRDLERRRLTLSQEILQAV